MSEFKNITFAGLIGPGAPVTPYKVDPFVAPKSAITYNPQPAGLTIPTAPVIEATPSLVSQVEAMQKERAARNVETTTPNVLFNDSTNELFVNGLRFHKDDADKALKSRDYLGAPTAANPSGSGWRSMSPIEYEQYLGVIENPTLREIFGKNFRMGLSNYALTTGALRQFAGQEEAGSAQVLRAKEQLRMRSPYARKLTGGDPAIEWFVAAVGQAGPNLLESVGTALAGAGIGSSVAPGAGTVAGGIAGVFAKSAFKKSAIEIAEKYAKGEALDAAEIQLLKAASGVTASAIASAAAKRAAAPVAARVAAAVPKQINAVTGAATASIVSSYGQSVGQVYNEIRENGAGADDGGARLAALIAGVPMAALEVMPEFIAAKRIFGIGSPVGEGFLKRVGKGIGQGALLEGGAEAGQEAIQMGASDIVNQKNTVRTLDGALRIFESFMAGAAIGGPLGGIANLRAGKPADLQYVAKDTAGYKPGYGGGDVVPYEGNTGMSSVDQGPSVQETQSLPGRRDLARTYDEYSLVDDPAQLANSDVIPYIYDAEFEQAQLANRDVIPTSRDVIPIYDEYSLVDDPAQLEQGTAQIGQDPAPLQLDYTGPAPTQYPEDGLPFGDNYNPPTSDVGPNRYAFTTQDGREVVQAEPFILPPEEDTVAQLQADRDQLSLQLAQAEELGAIDSVKAILQEQIDAIDNRLAQPDMQQTVESVAPPVVAPGKAKLQRKAAAAKTATAAAPKAAALKKGKANVVQEPSTAAVAGAEQAGSIPAAPAGDGRKRAPARARAAVKAQAKPIESASKQTVPTETPVQATVEEAAASIGVSLDPQTAPPGSPKSTGPMAAPAGVSSPESVLRNLVTNGKAAVKDGISGGLKTSDEIKSFQDAVRDLFNIMLHFDDGNTFGTNVAKMGDAAKQAYQALINAVKGKNVPPHVQEHVKQQILFAQEQFIALNKAGLPNLSDNTAKLMDAVYGMESPRMRRRLEDGSELDADAIRFSRDEVTSAVDEAMSGWANKPKVTVYLDTGELRTLNRQLYDKIKRANPMFDQAGVVEQGVYVRSEGIILFSSAFTTKKEVAFVLAHEALGHFGLRAVLSDAELRSQLKYVYDNSPNIRAKADALAELYGNDPIQNTEEVLADMAGEVQPGLITRLWNKLKAALGLADLGDVWARYMISRARKYVVGGDYRVVSTARLQANMFQFQAEVAMSKRTLAGTPGSILWNLNRSADQSRDYSNDVQGVRDRLKNTSARGAAGATLRFLGRALESVQTLDNKSARNEGLYVINDAFRLIAQRATGLKTKWRNMTGYTRSAGGKYTYTDKATGKRVKIDGPKEEDLKQADEMLANSALYMGQKADALANQFGNLFKMMPNGDIVEDKAEIAKVKRAGILTPEQFTEGFEVYIGQGDDKRTVKMPMTATTPAYRVYVEQREAINDAAIERLRSAIAGQAQTRAAQYRKIGKVFKQYIYGMDTVARKFIERVEERYSEMYYKDSKLVEGTVVADPVSVKQADAWLAEVLRGLHNMDKRADWLSPRKAAGHPQRELADDYKNPENQFVIDGFKAFGKKVMPKYSQYQISKILKQEVLNAPILRNANLGAIKTITSSYVSFYREGKYQLRIQAIDRDGNVVRLDPKFTNSLIFKQDDDQDFLMNFGRDINDEFRGVYIQAPREVLDPDAEPEMMEVELRAVVESSAGSPPLGDGVNLNEVIRALNMAGVDLKATDREKLILTLTRVGERVRKASLRRVGLTGWNENIIKGVETHLDTEAHIAAKNYYRFMVDDTMTDRSMWNGDRKKLNDLKAAIDKQTNPIARDEARKVYERYAIMYINSAPKVPGNPELVELNGKMVETKGRGNEYMEAAKRLQQWFENAGDLAISQNDFLSSNEFGSKAKALTVASQLGGVVASAAVNIVSIYTHSIPYLSGYNRSTGRGGGFGPGKTTIEINRALNEMKNPNFAEAEFLEAIVDSETEMNYGLTRDEALFLRNQTQEGILQAAQANATIGSARGGFDRNAGRAFEAWMGMFTYVEQLNRRTTALAAYRMYRDRALAAGASKLDLTNEESKLFKELHDAGRDAVNFSQGDYSMYNRPEMFRDNWAQYLFMYKMFVINTIQMIRNMPPDHRLATLALLFAMSGLKGLPFADDLMDLIDTIARFLGIKVPSVEKALVEFFDSMIPGSAKWFMRGGLDTLTGATFSTRFGMGDLIPLTGSLKPGADFQREFENFAGPVYGALMGYTRSGLELANGMPLTTVLRDSPMAAIRATADSLIYMHDGTVTNARGQVVNPDVGPGVVLWRALGFFPAESTITNDTIRLGKAVDNYAKSIKATYVQKYILAKNSKDSNRVAGIIRDVDRWNRDAKGTGLEMKDFRKNAEKSYKEASRPAGERYLRTTGKGVRSEVEQIQEMYGLTD